MTDLPEEEAESLGPLAIARVGRSVRIALTLDSLDDAAAMYGSLVRGMHRGELKLDFSQTGRRRH
jgi:hypothetical protein